MIKRSDALAHRCKHINQTINQLINESIDLIAENLLN
jgi:hypothetical protein